MEYGDLRVLEAVARHGSMNRAAVELNMVQSNVTARIRVLEEQVGTQLFDRTRRGVMLTAAGQRLLPYVTRLSALLKEAQEAARDDGTPRGTVRIGALETTAALRLPPILTAYTAGRQHGDELQPGRGHSRPQARRGIRSRPCPSCRSSGSAGFPGRADAHYVPIAART
jgi:molybdate transport repressor ModE-like protein